MFIKKNPQYLADSDQTHGHDTRHKNVYAPPKLKTTAYERGPLYSGLNFFNSIPETIKHLDSILLFKSQLKKILFDRKIYSINEMC